MRGQRSRGSVRRQRPIDQEGPGRPWPRRHRAHALMKPWPGSLGVDPGVPGPSREVHAKGIAHPFEAMCPLSQRRQSTPRSARRGQAVSFMPKGWHTQYPFGAMCPLNQQLLSTPVVTLFLRRRAQWVKAA